MFKSLSVRFGSTCEMDHDIFRFQSKGAEQIKLTKMEVNTRMRSTSVQTQNTMYKKMTMNNACVIVNPCEAQIYSFVGVSGFYCVGGM